MVWTVHLVLTVPSFFNTLISAVIVITRLIAWEKNNAVVLFFIAHNNLKMIYPPANAGSQKNLSAFCSNMLDEYLESEAQKISERAAAFSTNPEGRVSYQLPAKSSSYVKTLDSVLKHRGTASKSAVGSSRPCPLSHKHLFNFSSLAQTDPISPKGSPSVPRSAPSHLAAELKACSTPASHGTSPVQQM